MTLQEIIRRLDQYARGQAIYAVEPWQPSTQAMVALPREDGGDPDEAVAAGCQFFLEVFIAQQFLQGFLRSKTTGEQEECAALIEYAEYLYADTGRTPLPRFLRFFFPRSMMIYCNACAKLFDVVIPGEGPRDYQCPTCGKVHAFDLSVFLRRTVEHTKKMLRKKRSGR